MPTLHLLPAERRSDTNCRKRLLANVRARRDMIVTKMAIRTQLRDRGDSSLHLERVEFMLLCPVSFSYYYYQFFVDGSAGLMFSL